MSTITNSWLVIVSDKADSTRVSRFNKGCLLGVKKHTVRHAERKTLCQALGKMKLPFSLSARILRISERVFLPEIRVCHRHH